MKCIVFRGAGGREVAAVESRRDPAPSRFEVVIAPRFASGIHIYLEKPIARTLDDAEAIVSQVACEHALEEERG